jgi:hypothetical protein
MRADMFKLIVERPRWGASHAPPVKLKKDPDQDRKFIGLKRHVRERADYSKSLNENLAPLVRYLRKQRGRVWDDVFSEICAGLDTGSTVKMHVRMHLKDFVFIGISTGKHGELLHNGQEVSPDQGQGRWCEFYVDPDDGILKDRATFWRARGKATELRRFSWHRAQPPKTSPDLIWIDDVSLLLKHKGIWYFYGLDIRPKLDDVMLLEMLPDRTCRDRADWTVIALRQLSKQELKRHGLKNGGGGLA